MIDLSAFDTIWKEEEIIFRGMTQNLGERFQHDPDLPFRMDMYTAVALNRSRSTSKGFVQHVRSENMLCAGVLLRTQLDTAMRYVAVFLVDDPVQMIGEIHKGTHVRNMRDRNGKKMTDVYLKNLLSKKFDWFDKVYDKASGFVHLSDVHFSAAFKIGEPNQQGRAAIRTQVSHVNKLPDKLWDEAVSAFCAATDIFHNHANEYLEKRNGCVKG